jgi:uncharacterized Rossmann fold enzyme
MAEGKSKSDIRRKVDDANAGWRLFLIIVACRNGNRNVGEKACVVAVHDAATKIAMDDSCMLDIVPTDDIQCNYLSG